MKQYKTVAGEASDSFTQKKSRFIGYVKPVSNAAQALDFINLIKSNNRDAAHNVYAYVVRDGNVSRYSDDGEPQGTAGIPVLEVLKKENLTDCVIVVTRYFGGMLLGTGGLVRAYSHAAKLALDAGKTVCMSNCCTCLVKCDYDFYSRLLTALEDFGAVVTASDFGEKVAVDFYIGEDKFNSLKSAVTDLSNGRFYVEKAGELFAALRQ